MRAINRLQQMAVNLLELPKDAIVDVPRITLIGGLQAVVENHTGIIEFTDIRIRLAHQSGEIHILGSRLMIKIIQPGEIVVEGTIEAIKYA